MWPYDLNEYTLEIYQGYHNEEPWRKDEKGTVDGRTPKQPPGMYKTLQIPVMNYLSLRIQVCPKKGITPTFLF